MASANQSSIITRAPEMSSRGSSAAFGQTLRFITSIKLQELEKQRLAFQEHAQVLQKAEACGDNLIEKVELLLEAVENWSGSGSLGPRSTLGGKLNLANLRRWLPQAKQDPNFSADNLRSWIDTFETHIRHNLMRFDCAKLFGNLFNEWIASGDSSTALPTSEDAASAPGSGEDFEKVGRNEMYDQLERLKSIIFEEAQTDISALEAYLSDLFSSKEATNALEALRKEVDLLQNMLKRQTFTASHVGNLVRGLLASGLMDEVKRATLAEFLDNQTVLTEVASVLTMRMASIETWEWQEEGIVVEMRRHLNGKYRAFTDPEIIDALLLQHIGISWQVKLKSAFIRVLDSKAWKRKPVEDKELAIYQKLFDARGNRNTIDGYRLSQQRQSFFLSQLSSSMTKPSTYDDLLDTPGTDDPDSPAAIKQRLLCIMATEAQLNSTLYGTHSVVRSDLEWFGPSLPHQSILTVLKFFGVSDEWSSFFQRFLRAPLRFKGDPAGQVRTRLRGTPISYALSVVCGEALLFVMDFAVNQKADGLFLYRMHDDLWLWDADAAKCAAGWKEMNIYANLVGLKFNASKTGSASVGTDSLTGLPEGDIRWGFLHFDPSKARFVINQKDVDLHIKELRRQLSSTKSVFGWVNAYNKYMAFFLRNFGGRPATCFGKIHVQDILDTTARIQKELFPDIQGGAVAHLRSVIEERFGMRDLPQGYFYLPISNGGLELRHPMIEMFALLQSFDYDTDEPQSFEAVLKTDEERYKELKDVWDRGPGQAGHPSNRTWDHSTGRAFMSFEQYASLREARLPAWSACYESMLSVRELESLEATPLVESFLSQSKPDSKWECMDWYQQWILSLYGEEVVKRFGGWEVVDSTLIPVGMAELFRTSRMKLDE
ncbi:hypothetical protein H0H92_014359 [Tricholoma furcatifolium]|nr:hypothetical protein H0H92_014359 [Tricholoma furcatifolium]